MTQEEIIKKLEESTITEQDKINIFNWYLKNKAPERIATFQRIPGREFRLSEQTIITAESTQAKKLLEHSIQQIKKELKE